MSEEQKQVVTRRRSGGRQEEEEPHGGAWKVAWADFMTTMMALFLVLWITNSTSKETKSLVAQYFNPIQMVNTSPVQKGLHDPRDARTEASQQQKADGSTAAEAPPESKDAADKSQAESKGQADGKGRPEGKDHGEGKAHVEGKGQGDHKSQPEGKTQGEGKSHADGEGEHDGQGLAEGKGPAEGTGRADQKGHADGSGKGGAGDESELFYNPIATLDSIASEPPEATDAKPARKASSASRKQREQERMSSMFDDPFDRFGGSRGESAGGQRPGDESAGPARQNAAAQAVRPAEGSDAGAVRTMRQAIDKILRSEGGGQQNLPHVEVTQSEDGLLISLTDSADFSMFNIGSIKPKPQLVRLIGEVGGLLEKTPGEIEVRGHTDARPYRNGGYDNWRLSTDRANMAYYMLVRGGLAEKRIVGIVGFADRRLKTQKDPLAANNRRIEILIKKG